MAEWTPDSLEDRLLAAYHTKVGGRIYTEVAVPWSGGRKDWPDGYRNRYIDTIRLPEPDVPDAIIPFANHGNDVLDAVAEASVELIEIKTRLNRPVIGQILAGDVLFHAEYVPADVHRVALCETADPALAWVCEQRNTTVVRADPID